MRTSIPEARPPRACYSWRIVARWLARLGIATAIGLAVAAGYVALQLATYEEPAVDPAWAVPGSTRIPEHAVTVRWTGTATLVFSDGETTWLTDGWFSRPGPLALLFGEIEPDRAAIAAGLARNGVDRAAAVFPVHSHYDHAMDAPEVARLTGALLLGSESTANIGRGWGLPEDRIRAVADREPIELGRFTLTPIESRHFQFPDPWTRERALGNPEITEPLVPPVGAFDYRLGKAYVLHVSHPLGKWLIVGSAGFVEGALTGGTSGSVISGLPSARSRIWGSENWKWRDSIGVSVKRPSSMGSRSATARMRSSGNPQPRPMFAVDSEPSSNPPVRRATSGASMAWS